MERKCYRNGIISSQAQVLNDYTRNILKGRSRLGTSVSLLAPTEMALPVQTVSPTRVNEHCITGIVVTFIQFISVIRYVYRIF
jgi:hypothetical protein